MAAIDELRRQHDQHYSDMSFDEFLKRYQTKNYPDMDFEDFSQRIGYGGPGYEPVAVKGTSGPPMEPMEALTGTTPMPGIEKYYRDIGGSVGGIVGGVPGAALGGAAGEAARQYISGEELSPSKLITEGGIQGGLELAGVGTAKAVGKVLAPSSAHMLPETVEAGKAFERFGGSFSPAQAVEGKLIDMAEGVAEASMTGGPKYFRFREGQKAAYKSMAKNLTDRLGSSLEPREIGMLFVDAIEKSDKVFREQATALYKNVDRLTAEAGVDITPLKEFAHEKLLEVEARGGIGGSATGDQLIKRIEKLPSRMSFNEAASLRSGLGIEVSSFEGKRDAAAGIAKKLYGLTNDAMEVAAKDLGDEAYTAWKKASDFYKEGKATFQSEYIRGLTNIVEDRRSMKGAEAIASEIFKPGRETAIINVKRALRDKPHVWSELRGAFLSNAMKKSANEEGVIIGKAFTREIDKMGDNVLKQIFSPDELKGIRDFAAAGRISQTRPIGGGSMLIQLTQASAIVGLVGVASGRFPKSGGTILLGPWALAHLMTSPTGIKWLTTGIKTGWPIKEGTAITGRIISELVRSGAVEDVELRPY